MGLRGAPHPLQSLSCQGDNLDGRVGTLMAAHVMEQHKPLAAGPGLSGFPVERFAHYWMEAGQRLTEAAGTRYLDSYGHP